MENLKTLKIKEDVHKKLKMLCAEKDLSMSEAIEYLLSKELHKRII